MQFLVGSFKLGLSGSAKLQFSAIEANNRLHSVARLGDLPQMLRRPLPKSRTRPVVLPNIGRNRSSIYLSPPALIDPPQAGARLAAEETPAPRPAWSAQPRTFRGLSASEIITRVSPVYPPPAKEFNAFGEVRVEITADEKGRVIDARAISGHVMLYKAAEEAARRWVFKPVFIDGKPARRESTLTFIFTRPQ
jgi:TonB family protein